MKRQWCWRWRRRRRVNACDNNNSNPFTFCVRAACTLLSSTYIHSLLRICRVAYTTHYKIVMVVFISGRICIMLIARMFRRRWRRTALRGTEKRMNKLIFIQLFLTVSTRYDDDDDQNCVNYSYVKFPLLQICISILN